MRMKRFSGVTSFSGVTPIVLMTISIRILLLLAYDTGYSEKVDPNIKWEIFLCEGRFCGTEKWYSDSEYAPEWESTLRTITFSYRGKEIKIILGTGATAVIEQL